MSVLRSKNVVVVSLIQNLASVFVLNVDDNDYFWFVCVINQSPFCF